MSPNESCAVVDNLRDLEQALKKKGRVIAMVYASWCPFFRKALPVFEKQVSETQHTLLLVTDDEEHVADLYGIDIFPTLILFERDRSSSAWTANPALA